MCTNSEGVCIEYVAIFFATLFPGALVSFNNEVLQSLPAVLTSEFIVLAYGIMQR